ncbi:MAG: YecA family protein [Myxococcota bacterium]
MRALLFSLRFLVLYAILQGAFAYTPLGLVSAHIVASIGAPVLQLGSGKAVSWAIEERKILIRARFRNESGWKQATARLGVNWYTRSIPLFLALWLASLPPFTRRSLAFAGVGTLLMTILEGLIVASHAWAGMHGALPYNAFGYLLSVIGVWTLGGFSVAPLFVAALLVLRLAGSSRAGPEPARGRNAPCPCGSGLKYKRCCGREAHA